MPIVVTEIDDKKLLQQLALLRTVVNSKEIIKAERKAAIMLKNKGYEKLIATLIGGKSEHLAHSFTYKLRNGSKSLSGIRVGFSRPGGNVAHLVDRGTVERYTKSGAYRGKIKGSHFWTDTRDQYGPQAMEMMMNAIEDAINKINSRS